MKIFPLSEGYRRSLTTSLHFLMVSLFPRLSSAFLALAEKLRVDSVLGKFKAFGHKWAINNVFEPLPAASKMPNSSHDGQKQNTKM